MVVNLFPEQIYYHFADIFSGENIPTFVKHVLY